MAEKLICNSTHYFRKENKTFPKEVLTQFFSLSVSCLFSLRWRLQRAFYTPKSVGKWGCQGVGLEDLFLASCKCGSQTEWKQLRRDESGPLTLGDLGPEMKPQYISNVVVNEWSLEEDEKQRYELLVMSPTVIERLDRREGQDQFKGKLEPKHVKLSAAMATSAAAVARNVGAYEDSTVGLRQLQVVLGLGMDSFWVSDAESLRKRNCCWEVRQSGRSHLRYLVVHSFSS